MAFKDSILIWDIPYINMLDLINSEIFFNAVNIVLHGHFIFQMVWLYLNAIWWVILLLPFCEYLYLYSDVFYTTLGWVLEFSSCCDAHCICFSCDKLALLFFLNSMVRNWFCYCTGSSCGEEDSRGLSGRLLMIFKICW